MKLNVSEGSLNLVPTVPRSTSCLYALFDYGFTDKATEHIFSPYFLLL
jgi:hypothetical protein